MERETVDTQKSDAQKTNEREILPGTPIVRNNTPRPFMYSTLTTLPQSQLPAEPSAQEPHETHATLSTFPTKPPSAPPLPEEPDEFSEADEQLTADKSTPSTSETQEFAWLFEYGLEMDSTLLNTPERLDGLALLYGPAILKGYRLHLGSYKIAGGSERTAVTLVPDARPHAEVWGVLYRVPQYVVQEQGTEPALADIVHAHAPNTVQAMHVFVQETYRNRTIPCITYSWQNTAMLQLSSAHGYDALDTYIRRLTVIAKKQMLPEVYTQKLAQLASMIAIPDTPSTQEVSSSSVTQRAEQQTEPLVIPVEKLEKTVRTKDSEVRTNQVQRIPIKAHPQRWFVGFSLYLVCLLLAILTFAVMQGIGIANDVLNEHFTLLNVPWLILVYGLLGGCVSSIITLGRTSQPLDPPVFVIVTWFTRPFVGAILALFTYLLLNSGIFLPATPTLTGRHEALFLLLGAVAGMCEGWLFLRKA